METTEEQTAGDILVTVTFSWDALPSFADGYVVERALIRTASDPRAFSAVGRVPAASGSGGRLSFVETLGCDIMTEQMPVYRVRAEEAGVLGAPSEERVVAFPPTDPGPLNPCQRLRGGEASTPVAPRTGTQATEGDGLGSESPDVLWIVAAVAAGLAAVAAGHAASRRI